jgi:hypothetical protein
MRHGMGHMRFADGAEFRGRWEADCWVQSSAVARHCSAAGGGLSASVAGTEASFVIQVWATPCTP